MYACVPVLPGCRGYLHISSPHLIYIYYIACSQNFFLKTATTLFFLRLLLLQFAFFFLYIFYLSSFLSFFLFFFLYNKLVASSKKNCDWEKIELCTKFIHTHTHTNVMCVSPFIFFLAGLINYEIRTYLILNFCRDVNQIDLKNTTNFFKKMER